MENKKLIEVVSCFNLLVSITEEALIAKGKESSFSDKTTCVVKENIKTVVNDIAIAYHKSDLNTLVSWISSAQFIKDILNEDVGNCGENYLSIDQLRRMKGIAKSQVDNIKFIIEF